MSGSLTYDDMDNAIAAARIELDQAIAASAAAVQRQTNAENSLNALIAQRDAMHNTAVQQIIDEMNAE